MESRISPREWLVILPIEVEVWSFYSRGYLGLGQGGVSSLYDLGEGTPLNGLGFRVDSPYLDEFIRWFEGLLFRKSCVDIFGYFVIYIFRSSDSSAFFGLCDETNCSIILAQAGLSLHPFHWYALYPVAR